MFNKCAMLGIFLSGSDALAQQGDRVDLGRLETGATVLFVRVAEGQWGIEITGGAGPRIVQPKLAALEVYRSDQDIRQLAAGYNKIDKAEFGIDARADITLERNVAFHLQDHWSLKGAVLSVSRKVEVAGNAQGGFDSFITLTVEPSVPWTDIQCLAPGLLYGDPTYDGAGSPGGTQNYAAKRFLMREDILAAPLFALSFKNDASVTVLDPAPRGDTTREETTLAKPVVTDARLQFGALGAWQIDNNPIEFGFRDADTWVKFLVDTLGKEPGLAFWDACNEPDYPQTDLDNRGAYAAYVANAFRKLDGHTPVTIGWAYESNMEKYADDVDVLVFHDYLQTREAVRTDIETAKAMGAKVKKQVMNDEMGCVCRANPYDMTIQQHLDAHIGFYIWELTIVFNNGRGWGDVHGIFYPDGTVRDPSIPMAMMGIFRNRGSDVVLEVPNREGRVTREITEARAWLENPNADYNAGLDLAEVAANLLESAQLVPLRELPTRQIAVMRRGQEDRAVLRTLLQKDIAVLQQYAR